MRISDWISDVCSSDLRYVYIALNRTFRPDYFIKYSELERVEQPGQIRHPIIREALTRHDVGPAIELVSMADIPAGTGLGSSGTFTVGLLRALYAFQRAPVTPPALAEEACEIETDRIGGPRCQQAPYTAPLVRLPCPAF